MGETRRERICQLWVFQSVAIKEDSLLVGILPDVTSPSNAPCRQKKMNNFCLYLAPCFMYFKLLLILFSRACAYLEY